MKRFFVPFLGLLIAACGSNSSPTTPSTPAAATVSSVALAVSTSALVKKGATAQATATATMSTGATQDVTSSCTNWASDNTAVATISSGGLLTAQGSGASTITTTCSNVQGRNVVNLSLVTKATPQVTFSSGGYGFTSSAATASNILFKLVFAEVGNVYGFNFNFLNLSVKDSSGNVLATTSVGPGYWSPSNHWNPGVSSYGCFGVQWGATPHPSSVVMTYQTSVQDDLGNTTNFTDTRTLNQVTTTYNCDANALDGPRSSPLFPLVSGAGLFQGEF
jgi:hypothetical protein